MEISIHKHIWKGLSLKKYYISMKKIQKNQKLLPVTFAVDNLAWRVYRFTKKPVTKNLR